MRILEVGPSPNLSNGGMATVIKEIENSKLLNELFDMDTYETYIDGVLAKRLLFSIYAYLKFVFIYKKYDIFHIHVASYGSTFRKGYYVRFLKKREKKVILHIHGAEYLVFYNKLSLKGKKRVNDIWNKADVVIALSEEWKNVFDKLFAHKNIIVIHNGIDLTKYEQGRCNIEEYKNCFLALGRLGKRKGTYDIIEAVRKVAEKYPEIKVYLAGDGDVDQCKNKIELAGLHKQIIVTGWLSFHEKISLMKQTATILLPSYNEGLPMAILEGMAAGKIIISTKVGGIPEMITTGDNGILIDPGNIDALAKSMTQVIEDIEFDNKCAANNINKVCQTYNISIMHKKLADVFRSLTPKLHGKNNY